MPILTEILDIDVNARLSDFINLWWRIDILVVADTIVSFGPEQDPRNLNEDSFGMSHLIGVLEGIAKVTKAHRGSDPLTAAGVRPNFRFDQHDLGIYDQIWLLGYGTGTLPPAEVAAIAKFMNEGGGVFATGDHGGLGSALAGDLPRVRSMRHWASPPPPLGPTRVDTTRPDRNNIVVFENQSDDIPQKLRLKWYQWSRHRYYREIYPHPLLCSRSGAITEFPDHMHEGEVVIPDSLDVHMTLPGMSFDEYPKGSSGERVSPEIVAWGWTTGRADPEVMHGIHVGDDEASNARWTGTIGAYDGHKAGVGRVVVHSTWHHFFDINLIGDNAANRPGFNDPRAPIWRKGFTASPEGQQILAQIDQYYRNIVRWLSPNVGRHFWFDAVVAQVARIHHVREVLEGGTQSAQQIGAYAWEYALRLVPPCTLMELSFEPIYELLPIPFLPWDEPRPGPDDVPMPSWPVPPKELAQASLGGALLAFTEIESLNDLHPERANERLRVGAVAAVRDLVERELDLGRSALEQLERGNKLLNRKPPAHHPC